MAAALKSYERWCRLQVSASTFSIRGYCTNLFNLPIQHTYGTQLRHEDIVTTFHSDSGEGKLELHHIGERDGVGIDRLEQDPKGKLDSCNCHRLGWILDVLGFGDMALPVLNYIV